MTPLGARRPLVVIAVLAASLVAASPASAEGWSHEDAQQDVGVVVEDATTGTTTLEPAPEATHTDITQVFAEYDRSSLVVVLEVHSLERLRDKEIQVRVRTPRGDFLLVGTGRSREGRARVYSLPGKERVACRARVDVRAVRNYILLEAPGRCFGSANAAQVGVALRTTSGTDTTVDDALRDGPSLRTPRLGPWLSHHLS